MRPYAFEHGGVVRADILSDKLVCYELDSNQSSQEKEQIVPFAKAIN